MQHVFENFLNRLLAVYGEPKSDDAELFASEYSRVLEKYAADELSLAADSLLATFKFGHWPKITDCVEACDNAQRDLAMQRAGNIPKAGVPGTGWRISDSGKKWFQIERGTPEFRSWMRFLSDNGKVHFALQAIAERRTWVPGSSPSEFGGAMLAYLDGLYADIAKKREGRAL